MNQGLFALAFLLCVSFSKYFWSVLLHWFAHCHLVLSGNRLDMPVDRYIADLKRFYSKLPFLGLYFFRCIGIRWYEMFSRSLQDYASSLLRFSLRIQILAQIDLNGGSSEKAKFLNRPLYWKLCSCISEKMFCNIKTYLATLNGNSCSVKQQNFSAFMDKPAPTSISQLRLSINHQIPNISACITQMALLLI